jgi:spermidine synthase
MAPLSLGLWNDHAMTNTRTTAVRGLLVLFVLSGAAGLIYEVVWARQLVLVFGNTSQAVSTILTGFFGGLAIGGAVGGRLADRVRRPLRIYGILELIVVVVVALTPVSFRLIGELYRGVYPALVDAPLLLALVRFALSILALAPATLLMGATLPTLTRFLTQGGRGVAGAFQRLYTANTFGAILGTALAGFVLIEELGLTGALLVGAVCSATAGVVALLLDRRAGSAGDPPDDAGPRAARALPAVGASGITGVAVRHTRRLALTLAFVSGLTSLGYQVTWNRLLGAGTGSSTYVFTIILALFLIGIALGAGLLGILRTRVRSALGLIAVAQILTAAFVLLGAAVLSSPASPFNGSNPDFPESLRQFAIHATLVVLPATVAMGLTFPATASLLGDETGSEGTATGSLLAVNTVGSLVATFVLPFFVIPAIGSPTTLAGLAILNAVVGVGLIAGAPRIGYTFRWVGGAIGTGVAILIVMALVGGSRFQNPTVELIKLRGGEVFAATEDEIAATQAGEVGGTRLLWVNGTAMTLLTVDTKFMPLLPLSMRPNATRGLTIAFGMGSAFHVSLTAGIRTDAVELVPSVPKMFGWFYPDADAVLANPEGKVVIADGRNHVELTSETYDYIVVDPPPPIESAGVSVISTVEFYRASKARLKPDGVMVQWVPYGQSKDDFLAHVRSFLSVFANVRVIAGAGGYGFYMIGSDGPVDYDPAALVAVLDRPGVLADVNSAPDANGRSAEAWAKAFTDRTWAAGDQLRAAVGGGPVITDDRPLPEYFLIRRLQHPNEPGLTLGALRDLLK